MAEVTIDFVTFDRKKGVYALCLVESIDWERISPQEKQRELKRIQTRIFDLLDAVIDGAILRKYPEAKGFGLCVQVDSPFGEPPELNKLIHDISNHLAGDNDYGRAVRLLPHAFFRVVSGNEEGRYKKRS